LLLALVAPPELASFEVVAATGPIHIGQIQTGMAQPIIIGQGSELNIRFIDGIYPIQVDGEPWEVEPSVINIKLRNNVPMIANPDDCHAVVKKDIK
jgi:hypothetical protein